MNSSNTLIKSRKIEEKEIRELFRLKQSDITLKLLQEYFAFTEKSDPKFNTSDYFILPANKLYNKSSIQTTVGRYIFNLFILNDKISPNYIEYMNYPMNNEKITDLDNRMSELLLNDTITTKDFSEYIDKMQWFCFSISKFINTSLTTDLIILPKKVEQLKKKLIKENEEEFKKGNVNKVVEVENELLKLSKEALNDLPDMDIYDSGFKASFKNNFKNTSLMRGCIKSLDDPTKIYVSSSSLEDGIPPNELHAYADILNNASYSRAISTQDGGYEGKKLSAAFQNVVLDERKTDCHTKKCLRYLITKDNYKLFLYRYIKSGNGYILMNDENYNKFIGKVCEIRSPLFCTNDKICNICAGELYYMLGIKNVGLLANTIGSTILNSSLKAMHDMSIKLTEISIEDYID